jgi:hypothetical protein
LVAAVTSPTEFWLCLHRLAEAYDAEGLTPDERAENIAAQFLEMSPIARRQVHGDLLRMAVYIPDLAPIIAAAEANAHKNDAVKPLRRVS